MTCLKDIKYLTKKKVLKMQPIYYVGPGLKVGKECGKWWLVKLEGEKLEKALDNFLLYEDYRCFTTEQEAKDLMNKYNKFIPEPERKPAVNLFAVEQVIRTMPTKGVVPLPIVDEQISNKEEKYS